MTRTETLNTARLFSSRNQVESALNKLQATHEMLAQVPGYSSEAKLARDAVAHLSELVYRLQSKNDQTRRI